MKTKKLSTEEIKRLLAKGIGEYNLSSYDDKWLSNDLILDVQLLVDDVERFGLDVFSDEEWVFRAETYASELTNTSEETLRYIKTRLHSQE